MEGRLSLNLRRRGIVWPTAAVVLTALMLLVMLPEVASVRYIVGSNMGWSPTVNYTIWAQGRHFYNGDWLFFVYNRNQMNVLEVNKTDFEQCNSDHPLHNWTTGFGRDVVPLNVTKTYYFISGKGFCYGGMKVAVHVENSPPPPTSLPQKNDSAVHVENPPTPSPTSLPQKNDPAVHVENPPPPPASLPQKNDPAVHVENPPPPPTSLPQKNDSPSLLSAFRAQIFIPTIFAVAAIWDAFILV